MIKAVQQFQLRTVTDTQEKAENTLRLMKEAGYDGIELCGFMIRKMPVMVRALTRLAGMPMGRSGNLDWEGLIKASGLKVVSVHEDLGSILRAPEEMLAQAARFGTDKIVVTGMYRFDYSDREAVLRLAEQMNQAGERLSEGGVRLLYHNHNCEFRKVETHKTAYQLLMEKTDPEFVNFEFDSYWPTEAGADALALMEQLGSRLKLYHINDRGTRVTGKTGSILKSDSMELGYGNMNLPAMVEAARRNGAEAVILESHRNWAEKSPIKSFQLSAGFMNQYV